MRLTHHVWISDCFEHPQLPCPERHPLIWCHADVLPCRLLLSALDDRKYALASDYVRTCVLYRFGGIYMDFDVQVLKPLDDLPPNFIGYGNNSGLIETAIMGFESRHPLLADILKIYQDGGGEYLAPMMSWHLNRPGAQKRYDVKIFPKETFYPDAYTFHRSTKSGR